MGKMTDEQRDEFLSEARLGMLTLLREDGSPVTVPVWFTWTGEVVRMFTNVNSPKMSRIANDPRATLLVAADRDADERWIAFDGDVEIREEGGLDLAEELAPRYWDLSDPKRMEVLEFWREAKAALRVLELRPKKICSYDF